jgi:hypothetical protein
MCCLPIVEDIKEADSFDLSLIDKVVGPFVVNGILFENLSTIKLILVDYGGIGCSTDADYYYHFRVAIDVEVCKLDVLLN